MRSCPPKSAVRFKNYAPSTVSMQERIVRGLSQPEKQLPSFLLYDARGIRIFDRLSRGSRYSTARLEANLLRNIGDDLRRLVGPRATIVEYGSGTARTAAALARALGDAVVYVPVDLSLASLKFGVRRIRRADPRLDVVPLRADFHTCFPMPMARKNSRPLVYLSSCVLSTMDVPAAVPLLKGAANFCGQRGGVLLGVDLRGRLAPSAPTETERARKLLETFNLNVLAHLHRRYAARFRPERFEHALMTNQALCRTELRLVSRTDQTLKIDGRKVRVARGESILTEARRRFCQEEIEQLTRDSGTTIERAWFSADQTLALFYLRPGC